MKKRYLFCFLLIFIPLILSAQQYEWAHKIDPQHLATPFSRSHPVAIRQHPQTGDYYLAVNKDSSGILKEAFIEKRNAAQQLIWRKNFTESDTILVVLSDGELTSQGHLVALGYFQGSITLGDSIYTRPDGIKHGFLFEADNSGNILWSSVFNPVSADFQPVDLFIAADHSLYFTAEFISMTLDGTCSFHKADATGHIQKSEISDNFENRTFSRIMADDSSNVYMTGTCGNQANFDTLHPGINDPYQNFLVKYDSMFTAQWLITRPHLTFDYSGRLGYNGSTYYWAINEEAGFDFFFKLLKVSPQGIPVDSLVSTMPYSGGCFDQEGNSTVSYDVFNTTVLARYDHDFNLTWQDTIRSSVVVGDLAAYDSCFYMMGNSEGQDLTIGDHILPQATIFAAKWSARAPLGISTIPENAAQIFLWPNPAGEKINVRVSGPYIPAFYQLRDIGGRLLFSGPVAAAEIRLPLLADGIYYLQLEDRQRRQFAAQKVVIQH